MWGFPLAGVIPGSNIYKDSKACPLQSTLSDLLGPEADSWNRKLSSDRCTSPNDQEILASTREEQSQGKLSRDYSKAELDEWLGVGQWKAIRRRCIWQEGKQKFRNIDNARTSGTNDAALLPDTIHTVPYDFPVHVVRAIRIGLGTPLCGDLEVGLTADDQKDAYHSIPNMESQKGLGVIAFANEHGTISFALSYSHIFGLKAAVTNYNRVPELAIAVMRRCVGTLSWHFFDDIGTIACKKHGDLASSVASKLFDLLGLPINEKKHVPWSQDALHLGVQVDLVRACSDVVCLRPKQGRVERMTIKVTEALSTRGASLQSGEAASLRGELTYTLCTSFDKVGKFGLRPLSDRQYNVDLGQWNSALEASLQFYKKVLPILPVREISISTLDKPRCILYTDACWEYEEIPGDIRLLDAGLGAIFVNRNGVFRAFASQLDPSWLPTLSPRKTQIAACEAIAILDAVAQLSDQLIDCELLIFCDNIAVVCALVKGASSHFDIQRIISGIHVLLAKARCKWWVEYVPTKVNPADSPSRDGMECPWCKERGIAVEALLSYGRPDI